MRNVICSKRRFVNLKNPLHTLVDFREYLKLRSLDEFFTTLCYERFHPFNFTTGHFPGVLERDIPVSNL
jgi:hypothetical protein